MNKGEKLRAAEIARLKTNLRIYQMDREDPEEWSFRIKERAPHDNLERLFDTRTALPVMVLDMDNTGYRNPNNVDSLIRKYSRVFSSEGKIKSPEESRRFSWDLDLDGYGEDDEFTRVKLYKKKEAEGIAELVFKPPQDFEKTRERQKVIDELTKLPQLDELIELKNRGYSLVNALMEITDGVRRSAGDEDGVPFLDVYDSGAEKYPILKEEWSDEVSEVRDVREDAIEYVDQIKAERDPFHTLVQKLGEIDNPVLQQVFSDTPRIQAEVEKFITATVPLDLKPNPKEKTEKTKKEKKSKKEDPDKWKKAFNLRDFRDLFDEDEEGLEDDSYDSSDGGYVSPRDFSLGNFNKILHGSNKRNGDWLRDYVMKTLEPYFNRLGGVLEIAKKVRDEGWGKVTFDPTKPEGYTGGWNLEEQKGKQVVNDSPQDAPFVILSGANTSGKSFTMKSDFLIRLCAQSLGYAPAEQANLVPHTSFLYLDRASTDSNLGLSAFMSEVRNWKDVYPYIGERSRVYIDEGYSTTSPEDQAGLLGATASFIGEKGGSVMLATHNDTLLARANSDRAAQIFYLTTDIGSDGRFIRHFKLTPGMSEPHSYAVAKARNFPSGLLDRVSGNLAGEEGEVTTPDITYPAIERFDEAEREARKKEVGKLEEVFPTGPQDSLFHLYSRDVSFTPNHVASQIIPPKDFEVKGYEIGALKQTLGEMMLWNSPKTPAELQERQKLVRELVEGKRYGDINKAIGNLLFLGESVQVISRAKDIGINKALNPFATEKKEGKEKEVNKPTWEYSKEGLDAAIAFLEIHKTLLGDAFEQQPLLTRLSDQRAILRDIAARVEIPESELVRRELTDDDLARIKKALGERSFFGRSISSYNDALSMLRIASTGWRGEENKEAQKLLKELQDREKKVDEQRKIMNSKAVQNPVLTDDEREEFLVTLSEEERKKYADIVYKKDLEAVVIKGFEEIGDLNDVLPTLGLGEIPLDVIQPYLSPLVTFKEGNMPSRNEKKSDSHDAMWKLVQSMKFAMVGMPFALQELAKIENGVSSLISSLRATDSIALHQTANYVEEYYLSVQDKMYFGSADEEEHDEQEEEQVETDVREDAQKIGNRFNHLQARSSGLQFLTQSASNDTSFEGTLKKLNSLCLFASAASQEGFTPVTFNSTGEMRLQNMGNILIPKDKQVVNSLSMGPDERLQLLTGPNGSGKTFYEKGAVAAVLMALSTGYAPAESATMPVLDGVMYLDRVSQKQEEGLSSFSQELEYWKAAHQGAAEGKNWFMVADEAFSTTSPRYQSAFTGAVLDWVRQSPHYMMLSTHNHGLIESQKSAIKPYHFGFDIRDGKVDYHYTLQEGHERSHALEVARTMDLPEEILAGVR